MTVASIAQRQFDRPPVAEPPAGTARDALAGKPWMPPRTA